MSKEEITNTNNHNANINKNVLPMSYSEMNDFSKIVMRARMFTSMQSAEQVLLTMVAGREMGMGFIEACNSLYIVNGKVSLLAGKVGEMIKRSGRYDYKLKEHTNEVCEIEFFQKSLDGTQWESLGSSRFDLKDKAQAKLTGMNYDKYPRNMLFARALTNGARWHTPDVFGGAIYEPEELGAKVQYSDDGESVESVEVPNTIIIKPEPEPEPTKAEVIPMPKTLEEYSGAIDDQLIIDGNQEHELTIVMTEGAKDLKGNPFQKYVFAEVLNYIDKYGRQQVCDPEWRASREAYNNYADIHEQLKEGDRVFVTLKVNETTWKGRDSKFQNVEAFGDINPELQDEVDDIVEEVDDQEL
tara:strand:+ start:1506 stop:2573 length:1068 start_codon:yes stop_codon:yes gene_type:complete